MIERFQLRSRSVTREVSDKIWLVSFTEFDLGFFDEDERRVEPAASPFVPKL